MLRRSDRRARPAVQRSRLFDTGIRQPLRKTDQVKCRGGDSNPYSFRNQILSLARLPISPPRLLHLCSSYDMKRLATPRTAKTESNTRQPSKPSLIRASAKSMAFGHAALAGGVLRRSTSRPVDIKGMCTVGGRTAIWRTVMCGRESGPVTLRLPRQISPDCLSHQAGVVADATRSFARIESPAARLLRDRADRRRRSLHPARRSRNAANPRAADRRDTWR